MRNLKLVSAVITTHNREPEIVERALKSIVMQTYPNMEIFVVDDSNEEFEYRDAVKSTVEKYSDKSVTYIRHEKCMGACAARNTGLQAAKGEYIAFLDDDDEWKPEKIEKQLTAFVNDDIALVYCGAEVVNLENNIINTSKVKFRKGRIFDELISGNFIGSTSFPLLRTEALRAINGFDVLMESAQDYDVWLRISEKYEVNYVKDILVTYYIHKGVRISKNLSKRVNGQQRLIDKNIDYLKKYKEIYALRVLKIALEYASGKKYFKAMKRYFKAIGLNFFNIKTNFKYLVDIHKAVLR